MVEFIDVLHREAQRPLNLRNSGSEAVEGFNDGGAAVPGHLRRPAENIVAVPGSHRNDLGRRHANTGQVAADFRRNLGEALFGKVHGVHFVDRHGQLLQPQQMQQIAMAPRLLAHAFHGVDDQHRGIGIGGAGDHVLKKFLVARRIDDDIGTQTTVELDMGGIDGDALIPFGLQGVHDKGPLERHAAPLADLPQTFHLAVGQCPGFMQQAPDQG